VYGRFGCFIDILGVVLYPTLPLRDDSFLYNSDLVLLSR